MRFLALFLTALAAFAAFALLSRAGGPVAAQPAPARYAPVAGIDALQATQAPDYIATAAVAQAAAEVAIAQTSTAQAAQHSTQTAQAYATREQVTLQWAQVAVEQTQSAMTVTAQAVQAAQATGTFSAQSATASATAAIPAMTATRAAQVQAQERGWREWAIIWGLVAFVVIILGLAAVRWVHSRGVVREAQARAALVEAEARAYSLQMAAYSQATRVQISGGKVLVIVNGEITAERLLAEQVEDKVISAPQAAHMTPAQQSLIAFVKDVQRATWDWSAAYIPSDAAMGCAGSRWAAHVGTLKALGIVTVSGTGRPADGEHRTKLTGDWDLGRVLSALENGQLLVPTGD